MKTTVTGVKLQQIAIIDELPQPNSFVNDKQMQKKIVKSKYSNCIGGIYGRLAITQIHR